MLSNKVLVQCSSLGASYGFSHRNISWKVANCVFNWVHDWCRSKNMVYRRRTREKCASRQTREVEPLLDYCRRRWPNIKPIADQRPVFAVMSTGQPGHGRATRCGVCVCVCSVREPSVIPLSLSTPGDEGVKAVRWGIGVTLWVLVGCFVLCIYIEVDLYITVSYPDTKKTMDVDRQKGE